MKRILFAALLLAGCAADSETIDQKITSVFISAGFDRDAHEPDHLDGLLVRSGLRTGQRVFLPRALHRYLGEVRDIPLHDALATYAKAHSLVWTAPGPNVVVLDVSPVLRDDTCSEGLVDDLLAALALRGEMELVLPERLPHGRVAGAKIGERWSEAFERICAENGLHAARFGRVIAVSHETIEGGAPIADDESPRQCFERIESRIRDGRVSLDVDGACFGNVLVEICRQIEQPVRFDARVDEPVALLLKDTEARPLLSLLVRLGGVRASLEGDTLVFSGAVERTRGSIVFREAPVRGALELLARAAGVTIRTEGRVGGKATCELVDTAPLDALKAVAAAADCTIDAHGSTLVARARTVGLEDLAPERTLEGILRIGQTRLALVSGRVLAEGDDLEPGVPIEEIGERTLHTVTCSQLWLDR